MLEVCLTGGIAAGKSLACEQFRTLGVPVADSDEAARQVVEPGSSGLRNVADAFGAEVLTPDGQLDRAALRRCIFEDEEARQRLQSILHPLIRTRIDDQLREWAQQGHAWAVRAVPLLVETRTEQSCSLIIVVDAPESVQLARLIRRDGETLDGARTILARQASRWQRLAVATDVIDNGDDVEPTIALRPQVFALQRKFATLAGSG